LTEPKQKSEGKMQNKANLISGKSVALLVAIADVESASYGIIIRFLQGSIECVKSIPFIARSENKPNKAP
jgi:hypothetical protein